MNNNIEYINCEITNLKKPIEINIKPKRKYTTSKQWNNAINLKDDLKEISSSEMFLSLSFMKKIIKLKGFTRGCSIEYGRINKATFKYSDITTIYKVMVLENSKRIKIIIRW